MVVAAHNEFQLIYGNIDSLEEGGYDESVVLRAFLDQFNWGFESVKEGMNIGEKYLDFAAGAKEVSEFDLLSVISQRPVDSFLCDAYHGHKVGAVRSVMSEIGVWGGNPGVPTDPWSQCL